MKCSDAIRQFSNSNNLAKIVVSRHKIDHITGKFCCGRYHKNFCKIEPTYAVTADRDDERKFAFQKILDLRGERDLGDTGARTMRKPRLNTDATTLQELID